MTRIRTIQWDDPLVGATAARSMSGLDYLHAMARGEIPPPPIAVLLGFTVGEIESGRVTFLAQPAEYHYNPIGSVHGGMLCALCDSAMGCAVHTLLPEGVGYTTLELKINFLKALTRDSGPITCEGKAIHVGSRIATAEARVTDASGTLYGHATTTCLILK